ncbi:neo-calmodulin-like [Convolutriloba macropyga]|uniref:neo-calmodulin-like n=1 Tax=Convolutriloba macropyga TaxID=536237 RepID=UPI003F5249B2
MLRIDEISVGRATGRMSPTGGGSPLPSRKMGKTSIKGHKKGVPGGGGGGGAGSSSASHNTVPHISKMLAGQFNPIAFMHNRDNAKQSTGDGSGGGRNNQVESPFTEMKEAFDLLDEDKDGQISVEDLSKFMRLIGMSSSSAELSELIFEFDSDGDGFLSYQDFAKVLSQDLFEGDPNGDVVREAFRQFDQDGTGYVGEGDLCTIFQQLGEDRLADDEVCEIVREYNVNSEGAINYEQMIEGIQDVYKKHAKGSHDQH